ncbi:tRNA (adenosine(37)-N6)-threonylcarbamoyltransferase complex dimerization subunit type 1 TsaB [Richelia intracellularis]|uniref:tRNA (adenosine(37)-N6)-threonylcarbamoyltransferase complex dimerization subunit type 1 TsaB n=1 Tax=Richelia intracellularis TaxID=1164990 RepID=UPI00034845EA|nr:tRNA (adenosine(37)-N6)-threonylcarbamoyltransferase complex dimerization subunit type 1 TsaB [Richelia intracellularis]
MENSFTTIQTPVKYGLALHTTTPELGLAIGNFMGAKRYDVWNLERQVSNLLHQYIVEFIKPQTWKDLGFIAVAKGPGSFTGTRIGVVTARTLGQQLDIPVFAISTLSAIAWAQLKGKENSSLQKITLTEKCIRAIAVQMPAQRGHIFAGIYKPTTDGKKLKVLLDDTIFLLEDWQKKLASLRTDYELVIATSGLAKTVDSILEIAYLDWILKQNPHWSEALPYYGQTPFID